MELKQIISEVMFVNAFIAFAVAVLKLIYKQVGDTIHRLFVFMLVSSSVWSFGFSMLYVQTDVEAAHFWKSFAIAGTVGFMIASQSLTSAIAGIERRLTVFFQMISLLGIPVYILSIRPDQTSYEISKQFGFMTYRFHSGPVNTIYTLYFAAVSINILFVVIKMLTSRHSARLRSTGVRFLIVLLLTFAGTIFDMVFPALGYDSLPGSNVTQFMAAVVSYFAIRDMDRNRINVVNMSKYMYYSIKEPIILTDETLRLRIVNEAAREFFGLRSEAEFSKKTLAELFDFPDDGFFESRNRVASYDIRDRIRKRPCSVMLSRVNDRHGDTIGFIIVTTDMSERYKYIEELKLAREDAELSNRIKTTFLANMSHEIRTPMNSIIGFTELILKEDMPREQVVEYSENIRESANDLLKLINQILDITKVETGKITADNVEYDTYRLLDNALMAVGNGAKKKGLSLKVDLSNNIPSRMYGDETKIREILVNLLNNSVKYTSKGGITFSVTAREAGEAKTELEFVIADTGVGIKEEELGSIFKPFEQVNKNLHAGIEGTGLGLAIVKSYVEILGGKIDVKSTFGEGTTFTVSLVQGVVDPEPVRHDENRKMVAKSRIGNIRYDGISVLVVDDNLINLKVAGKTLECYGLTVALAESGENALELCKDNEYPIIFLDQMMPGMDGIETMHRIREISPYYAEKSKIVALTANALKESRSVLLAEGFDEYLKKPIEFDMLEALLEKYLGGDINGTGQNG